MFFDIKYAVRRLCRAPIFTVTALATLGLCVGANIVIFSVVQAVLLKPLPFPRSEELVTMANTYPKATAQRQATSVPNYFEWRDGVPAFAEIGSLRGDAGMVDFGAGSRQTEFKRATPSFFRALEISAAKGRLFSDEEGTVGHGQVAVLGEDLWKEQFGGNPKVIGRTFTIDGQPVTIIGVLPKSFDHLGYPPDQFWLPLSFTQSDRSLSNRHFDFLTTVARLKSGFSRNEAQAEIDAANRRAARTDPWAVMAADQGFRTVVLGLRDSYVMAVRPALLLLQGGVLLLLAIGAVNLFNLIGIRVNTNAKERAVRQAFGAGPFRLVMQGLMETLMITVGGGLLGVVVGAAGLKVLMTFVPSYWIPFRSDVSVSPPVIAATAGASVVLGFILAIPTIIAAFRIRPSDGLGFEPRGGTARREVRQLRHSLIVVQIALSLGLLTSASLLALSFKRVLDAPTGFSPDKVLIGSISLPPKEYSDNERSLKLSEKFLSNFASLPEIVAAGLSTSAPESGSTRGQPVWVDGYVAPSSGAHIGGHWIYQIAGGYFEALDLPLLAGRRLTAQDSRSKNLVCIVDSDFARHYWPGKIPLGRKISPGSKTAGPYTIVGIVGSVKQIAPDDVQAQGTVYLPFRSDASPQRFFAVVRTEMRPEAMAKMLQTEVNHLDPTIWTSGVRPLVDQIAVTLAPRKLMMFLALIFASLGYLLAAIGVYGVLAYTVARRRREFGIRMALGALPARILKGVLMIGGRLFLAGSLAGALTAWLAGRFLRSFLFGVGTYDPLVLATTVIALGLVVVLASLVPALRASRVSPAEALRSE